MTRASSHSGPHQTIEDRHHDLLLRVNNNEHATWKQSPPDESRCEVQAGTYVTAEVTVLGSRTRGRPRKFAISAEEQRERRRAQNRKAQRAYRERKDRLIGELQIQIGALQQQNSQLHGVQDPLELQQSNYETEL
ncbi:bZIP transcription factor (Fcr3) [Fusarium acutatum]|uniref:BZIP transcription factor (Fcr3) n=1 Tax=Fusarium acutatum TaxID=78861 RepID=A0A8H4J9N6_9HYPO|nr:bZIP transcription factor (Fcr3) [Fusarium acutatum]